MSPNQWLFNILIDKNVLKPSARFSYGDLSYGLPNTLMCIECILFSAAFWYAFSATEYAIGQKQQRLPLWKAALHSMNPYDLFHGVARAAGLVMGRRQSERGDAPAALSITRSGRGRYQSLEADAPAARSHSQVPFQHFQQSESQRFRESSPPGYGEDPSGLQPVATRYGDRSPSPSAMGGRYEAVRGRDMV